MAAKSFEKGKYTSGKDKMKDEAMTKNMPRALKEKFEKMDKAHGDKKKPKTMKEDKKMDAKLIDRLKGADKKKKPAPKKK